MGGENWQESESFYHPSCFSVCIILSVLDTEISSRGGSPVQFKLGGGFPRCEVDQSSRPFGSFGRDLKG